MPEEIIPAANVEDGVVPRLRPRLAPIKTGGWDHIPSHSRTLHPQNRVVRRRVDHRAHSRIPNAWLDQWLDQTIESTSRLGVIRHREVKSSDAFHEQLAEMLYRAKCKEERVARLARRVKWISGGARLGAPKLIQGRLGDFGEVLAIGILELFTPGWVPVVKLRTQPDADNSLHGTDIVVFRFHPSDDDVLDSLEFVEVKVATSTMSNARAAVAKAHEQLVDDRAINFLDTLEFIAERLEDDRPELVNPFMNYLASREDGPGGSNRILAVVDDSLQWEGTLDRLPDEIDRISPLDVHVATVAHLVQLVESVWALVPTRPLLSESSGVD